MLILSRKVDEKIKIGNDITLTIIEVKGEQVKIGVEAPKNVKVFRQEVFEEIQKENKDAATASAGISEEGLTALFKKAGRDSRL